MPDRRFLASTPPQHILRRAALAVGLLAAAAAGCQVCNDIGCDGGFEWNAETADGSGLAPGVYALEITLDGSVYAIDCTLTDAVGESDCTDPTLVEGDGTFDLSIQLSHSGNDWAPDAPSDGFYLNASDHRGSETDGSYSETRGPEDVHVVVLHDGQPFLEVEYEVTYVRDTDYRGDEDCGYCDERQTRDHAITR